MKRRILTFQSLVLSAVLFNTSALKADTTTTQTFSFSGASNSTFTDLGDGNAISIIAATPLNAFTKFDPALGTLTEILFTVEMKASYAVEITADQLDPISSPDFTVTFEPYPGSNSILQAGIVYSPSGASTAVVTTVDGANLPSMGVVDEPSAPYITDGGGGPQFSYSDNVADTFGGFASGGTTVTAGSLLTSNTILLTSDFVGTGNVQGVSVENILFISNDPLQVVLNNIPGAFIQPDVGFAPGNASLQYVYTPVPEPTVGFMALLGLAAALHRRR